MQQANEDFKKLLKENIEAAREIYMNYDEIVGEAVKESAEMDKELIEQATRLLHSTQAILTNQSEIARLNGENFNVFRLLDLERKEVKLHSRFIAELLDCKGSHDQGSVFLQMFLQQVGEYGRIEASRVSVNREYPIGNVKINDTDSTGGRIDIFITDCTRHISIENKIDYGEDDHQVDRYCNYEPDKNFVLFLTLEGKEANTKQENYKPISYKKHIAPWLEDCHRHCADLPILRETIKQYIHTIKNLTRGLIKQQENEDIKKLLMENIETAREICLNYEAVVDEAVKEFTKKVEKQIDKKRWEICNSIDKDPSQGGAGLSITNKNWVDVDMIIQEDKKEILDKIWIKWQPKPSSEYGIFANTKYIDRKKIKEKMGGKINEMEFSLKSEWWPFKANMDEANFQSKSDIFQLKNLFDEQDKLAKQLANKLVTLAEVCDRKLAN